LLVLPPNEDKFSIVAKVLSYSKFDFLQINVGIKRIFFVNCGF
jgi:hypothetical protein